MILIGNEQLLSVINCENIKFVGKLTNIQKINMALTRCHNDKLEKYYKLK